MYNKILKIIQIVFVVGISLLLLIQLFQKLVPNSNGFFGFRTFVIVSESMEPELKIGDIILVRKTDPKNIKINDIISYKGESDDFKGKIITHQVKNIMTEDDRYIFYTKGTNSDLVDPAVYEEQVYGVKIYKFFVLSIISKIIRNVVGFVLLVVLPLALLLVTEIRSVRKEIDERRE